MVSSWFEIVGSLLPCDAFFHCGPHRFQSRKMLFLPEGSSPTHRHHPSVMFCWRRCIVVCHFLIIFRIVSSTFFRAQRFSMRRRILTSILRIWSKYDARKPWVHVCLYTAILGLSRSKWTYFFLMLLETFTSPNQSTLDDGVHVVSIPNVVDVLSEVVRLQYVVLQCRISESVSCMSLDCSETEAMFRCVRVQAILKPFLLSSCGKNMLDVCCDLTR